MGFFKKIIGSEPTQTRLLGEFSVRSEHFPAEEKRVEKMMTRIYLHSYSTNSFKIEIDSTRKVPFSSFSSVTPSNEKRILDLQSRPTIEDGGLIKYILADLKVKLYGIVLLTSANNAVLIFPSKKIYTFSHPL
jgi:hypothetical protein